MQTTIVVRHTEIPDALRERAEAVMDRIRQLSPHALEGTVVFEDGPRDRVVEIRLHVRGGQIVMAHGEGPDHRTALDRAEDKVRRQLERNGAEARRTRRSSSRKP